MLAAKTEEPRIGPGYRGSKSRELLMNKSTILTSSRSYLSSLKLWNQRMDSKQCLEETSLLDRCLSSLIELALPTPPNLRRRQRSTPAVPSVVASNPLSTTLSNTFSRENILGDLHNCALLALQKELKRMYILADMVLYADLPGMRATGNLQPPFLTHLLSPQSARILSSLM